MDRNPVKIYLLLIVTTSMWGGAFIAGKISTQTLDPFTVAFLRFFGASLVLFPLMWKMEPDRPKRTMKDWLLLASLGFTGIFLYNACFFLATQQAPIIKSSLFIASNPAVIVILSGLFLKEKITGKHIVGMISAIAGVLFIVTQGDLSVILRMAFEPIDLVLLTAVFSWALYTVLGKVALKKFNSIAATTYATGFGTLMLFPFAAMNTTVEQLKNSGWEVWVSVLYVAFIVSVISFIWWYRGVQQIGAARASVFINIMPISASVMAFFFLGEALHYYHLVGAILVFGGVYISTQYRKSNKSQRRVEAAGAGPKSVS
ncbi:MAG: EamA family transporter [Bacillaceae bacterium]|nr:EamA family transporter [Bacillaceae bacterium]